jgi:hypothetical protein
MILVVVEVVPRGQKKNSSENVVVETVSPPRIVQPKVKVPLNKDDLFFLNKAYNNTNGMEIQGDTLYLSGTRWSNPQDVDADARDMLNNLESSWKYKTAKSLVLEHDISKVVGFSLGGAIADKLSNLKNITHARIYNSPSITKDSASKKRIFYNEGDYIQGFHRNQVDGMKLYKGSQSGHTMRGHQPIYS